MRMITFLSDYGHDDVFVGLCHAVIAEIQPTIPVVDLTHVIPPQDVLAGALALADSVSYTSQAVHLAVVDPGVGSQRRGVVIVAGDELLVGPDNGLLLPAARRLGGVRVAFELRERRYRREHVSRTFHGRDIFAPAAAHLAGGVQPQNFGPPVQLDALVDMAVPVAHVGPGRVAAQVRAIDRFGNIQLPVTRAHLEQAGFGLRAPVRLVTPRERVQLPRVPTFAELQPGAMGLIEDSFGWMAVVVNRGNAAAVLNMAALDDVQLLTLHAS